jgi:beta-mannosidase
LGPDPFYARQRSGVQWVGLADWQYETTFQVDRATLRAITSSWCSTAWIRLPMSISTAQADRADNMFRRWRIPVKTELHEGKQHAGSAPVFTDQAAAAVAAQAALRLARRIRLRLRRRAQGQADRQLHAQGGYQYGWDWGPRIVTEGIWQPVHLDSWNALRVDDFHIDQTVTSPERPRRSMQGEVQAMSQAVHGVVDAIGPDGSRPHHAGNRLTLDPATIRSLPAAAYRASASAGIPPATAPRTCIRSRCALCDSGRRRALSAQHATGLRSVELRRDKDAWGKSFAVRESTAFRSSPRAPT